MIPKFVRKKFAGVQQPLGRWILRHIAEFIVLSPAILVTWLWLILRRKEILVVGKLSNTISVFISVLEPELRRRLREQSGLERTIVLNLSSDANSQVRNFYDEIVQFFGEEQSFRRRVLWWTSKFGLTSGNSVEHMLSDPTWQRDKPSISFSNQIQVEGVRFLQSLQVSMDQPIICYATRSNSYYEKQRSLGFSQKSQTIRNPNEAVYLDVCNYFAVEGFRVFRMGKYLDKEVRTQSEHVFDYASNYRTDLLDVFLLHHCKFLLNGATGIFWFRALFNKPSAHADIYDIRVNYFKQDLFAVQRVWLEREDRFATFKEMLLMPGYSEEKHQERLGVRLEKNTVEEIKAVCDEMNARIDGTWVTTEEDEELQRRYQELIVKYSNKPEWNGGGRIGAQFLRDNQDLLRE